jgi:hypothetical protein
MNSRYVRGVLPFLIAVVAIFIVAFTPSVFSADEKNQSTQNAKEEVAKQTGGGSLSAMKAGRSEDGQLRQTTKEEDRALAAQIRNTISKYPKNSVKTHPNGAKSLVTVPHSLAFSVATVGQDGKVKYECKHEKGLDKDHTHESNEKAAEE